MERFDQICMTKQWRIQGDRIGRGHPFFRPISVISAVFLLLLFFVLFTPEVGLVDGRYPYPIM